MPAVMTIDGKVLVAVAMMLGATATTGCKSASEGPSKPEITPVVLTPEDPAAPSAAPAASNDAPAPSADAPVASASAPSAKAPSISDKRTLIAASAARQPAPPALREEAPSAHRVWVAAPMAPLPVIYEAPVYAPSEAFVYAPGYWRDSGREYVWIRRDAAYDRAVAWERAHRHHEARPYAPPHHAASRPSHPRFAPEHHAHPTMPRAPARMPARAARGGHGRAQR
jgi:hypothetical protein